MSMQYKISTNETYKSGRKRPINKVRIPKTIENKTTYTIIGLNETNITIYNDNKSLITNWGGKHIIITKNYSGLDAKNNIIVFVPNSKNITRITKDTPLIESFKGGFNDYSFNDRIDDAVQTIRDGIGDFLVKDNDDNLYVIAFHKITDHYLQLKDSALYFLNNEKIYYTLRYTAIGQTNNNLCTNGTVSMLNFGIIRLFDSKNEVIDCAQSIIEKVVDYTKEYNNLDNETDKIKFTANVFDKEDFIIINLFNITIKIQDNEEFKKYMIPYNSIYFEPGIFRVGQQILKNYNKERR